MTVFSPSLDTAAVTQGNIKDWEVTDKISITEMDVDLCIHTSISEWASKELDQWETPCVTNNLLNKAGALLEIAGYMLQL